MPRLSEFYGIVIYMYFKGSEHKPAHIHAYYNEENVIVDLEGNVLDGDISSRALFLIKEWISIHKEELLNMWNTQVFHKIPPLR